MFDLGKPSKESLVYLILKNLGMSKSSSIIFIKNQEI